MSSEIYNRSFFKRRYKKYHEREMSLANLWYDFFHPDLVLDLGCGIGSYLCGFKERGCLVSGYEYGYVVAKEFIPPEVLSDIQYGNLCNPITFRRSYDLVLSIEVAEHLPEKYADTFCNNLVKSADDTILLTAADVGQRGRGHINCQPKEYWIDKMVALGCRYDENLTSSVQKISGNILDLSERMMVFEVSL